MDAKQAAALREPFAPNQIGKLPRGGVELDYVGHAIVTNRLLEVDPEWSWEPLALDEVGLPAMDAAGNLWIKLTIAGVTRVGVGDGKNMKERISDSIRNAAMRFGVALDLWAKEDLHAMGEERGEPEPVEPAKRKTGPSAMASEAQLKKIHAMFNDLGVTDRQARLDYCSRVIGEPVESSKHLTKDGARFLIDRLDAAIAAAVPSLNEPPPEEAS